MQDCVARVCTHIFFSFVFTVRLRLWTGSLTVNKKVCGLYALLLRSIYNACIAQHLTMWTQFSFCLNKHPNQGKESEGGWLYLHPAKSQPSSLDTLQAHVLCFLVAMHLWILGLLFLQIWKWQCELCEDPTLFNSALRNNRSRLWGASHNHQ